MLTKEELLATAQECLEEGDDNAAVCHSCGAVYYGYEPDTRKAQCEECGAFALYGCEEILLMYA
ncbi:MAG: hypothetical protein DA330_01010 [Nitrososphaera sp.]|nr:hypothetical protein [Nitrososphaera sp.]